MAVVLEAGRLLNYVFGGLLDSAADVILVAHESDLVAAQTHHLLAWVKGERVCALNPRAILKGYQFFQIKVEQFEVLRRY